LILYNIRTTIGFGSLNAGEEKVHGAPLGDADIAQLKSKFGFNPDDKFIVSKEVCFFQMIL
jgi:transketolase